MWVYNFTWKVLTKIFLVFGKVKLLYNFVKKNAIRLQT